MQLRRIGELNVSRNRRLMKSRKRLLLVTISVIAVALLAAVVWLPRPHYRAYSLQTVNTLNEVAEASRQYFSIYGKWPNTLAELTTPSGPKRMVFLRVTAETRLADRWGHPLTYIPFDSSKGFGIVQSHARDRGGREVVFEVSFSP